jgi:transcriptional antiterminator RfaH
MEGSTQTLSWYVVYSKPFQEVRAETELAYQGFSVYLPKISEAKRLRGQWMQEIRPMFPRYLFVQPEHAEQSIAPMKSTRGVSHLVRLGANMVECPDTLIDTIRAAEARLNGEGSAPFVAVGETIEITEGPFQGLISRVVAATEDRVSILLEVLGELQSLDFPVALCRKV